MSFLVSSSLCQDIFICLRPSPIKGGITPHSKQVSEPSKISHHNSPNSLLSASKPSPSHLCSTAVHLYSTAPSLLNCSIPAQLIHLCCPDLKLTLPA
ncbi:hypothetical protein AMTR_s00132p00083790 [Amborella trichopoda]|uniref:Uncharacterized protein n=1 Tax=Amborella trichopoda TaxID=13333 RepID=W1NDN4_AMBTC|nr:hypothetical protein AMTR_s00132p00083790 [Amborella trichopoda]